MARWLSTRGLGRVASIATVAALAGCTVTEVASAPTEDERRASTTQASATTTTRPAPPPTTAKKPTTKPPKATTTTQRSTTTTQPTTTTTWPSNQEPIAPAPQVVNGTDYAQRLLDLGFWHDYGGDSLPHAIMAAQKYYGLPLTGSIDEQTLNTLATQTVQPSGMADAGDLIEIEKRLQLLFIIRGGKTLWVMNVSTGSEIPYEEEGQNESQGETLSGDAVTYPGLYNVWRQYDEKREGDLGGLWRPKYFNGGIAVHGSSSGLQNGPWSVPMSHGCTRVSNAAMDFIWEQNLMPLRSVVWVHGEIPT